MCAIFGGIISVCGSGLTVRFSGAIFPCILSVCKALSETFENGMTIIDAKGYYSNLDKTLIYFVVNRFQVGKMKNLVHKIDPKTYIAINEVADIFPANLEPDRRGK